MFNGHHLQSAEAVSGIPAEYITYGDFAEEPDYSGYATGVYNETGFLKGGLESDLTIPPVITNGRLEFNELFATTKRLYFHDTAVKVPLIGADSLRGTAVYVRMRQFDSALTCSAIFEFGDGSVLQSLWLQSVNGRRVSLYDTGTFAYTNSIYGPWGKPKTVDFLFVLGGYNDAGVRWTSGDTTGFDRGLILWGTDPATGEWGIRNQLASTRAFADNVSFFVRGTDDNSDVMSFSKLILGQGFDDLLFNAATPTDYYGIDPAAPQP